MLKVDNRYSTQQIYETLSLDKLDQRRSKHVLGVMYKIATGLAPEYLINDFEFKYTSYNLRNNLYTFSLPKIQTCFKKKTLSYHGAKLWNELSVDIKSKPTYESFKRSLNYYTTINRNILQY